MFRKISTFRRKESDEGRPSRFTRTPSDSYSPRSSLSPVTPEGGEQNNRPASVPSISDGQVPSQTNLSRTSSEAESQSGALGLNVIYTPDHGHKADIVFIHGLGGTSRWTWSKNKDPELFWPLTFLALEPELCLARIMTFGYNATLRKAGVARLSVLDFAKDLLFDLKYGKDQRKDELNMGSVPLIFVAHSMGGLIIKEAYIQGQHDPEYEAIVRAITAITFLATPHRGTHLAQTLNKILQSSMITNSKQYVADLATNSLTLQKLNEQFRHIAPKLDIVSFYETQPTSIGIKNHKVMVLEKDSSVLGYPGEMSKALDADHHGVCKYDSPNDPNYVTVRNVLKSIVSKIIATRRSSHLSVPDRKQSSDLKAMLSVDELPDTDYIFFQDQRTQGTNQWILNEESFSKWLHMDDSMSRILWIYGGPATGKSVMSSFVLNHLVEQGRQVQYFFIRFGDQKKRSLSVILRSLAYQMARSIPQYAQMLMEVGDEGIDFETADARTIWNRAFKSLLFTIKSTMPAFWIIDGLDEADDPQAIVRTISDISLSSSPTRVLFTSRRTPQISSAMQKASRLIAVNEIGIEGHTDDLRTFISHELNVPGSEIFTTSIHNRLLEGAQNNFLWIRLAVDRINSCHRQADVELALQELPPGMEALYDRMAATVAAIPLATDKSLAINILRSVTCALRVLKLDELADSLPGEMSELLDLERSVVDLCGGFVVVDADGNVAMVHQTAREYLLAAGTVKQPIHVDRDEAQIQLFQSCMRSLTTTGLRAKLTRGDRPVFLDYATSLWAVHLSLTPPDCAKTLATLQTFFTGPWVLIWIHSAASSGKLRLLVQASRTLSKFSSRLSNLPLGPVDGQYMFQKELIDSWAVDLIKIAGKFSLILRRNPEAIYKLIPPFCPRTSAIYQQFGKAESKMLQVSGASTETWDDAFARMAFGAHMSSIAVAASSVAVLASSGRVLLYDSTVFAEMPASPIQHEERVYRMELNDSATLLVTYGYRNVKVWQLPSGNCKWVIPNITSKPRPLAMRFLHSNKTLLIGSDDSKVRSIDLTAGTPTWTVAADLEEPELDGHFLNSANCMAFNRDGSLTVVAYRGHPLSAWETDGPTHVAHCWRKRDDVARGEVIEAIWHPHSPEVIGLYLEGVVFRWSPYDGEVDEIATGASRLALNKTGSLFSTGDVHGRVKVYTVAGFGLLYQLVSQDTVMGVAFSPDSRRLYDIRGHYGNTWEPGAMTKFVEQSSMQYDSQSEIESLAQSSSASENTVSRVDHVTALAPSPCGHLYCYGNDKGTVSLHSTHKDKLADIYTSKGFFSVELMTWSGNGELFAFSDSSRKAFLMSISLTTDTSSPVANTIAETSLKGLAKGAFLQLMFSSDSSQLLIHSSSAIHILSVPSLTIVRSLDLEEHKIICMTHPQDPTKILGVGSMALHIFDWRTSQIHTFRYDITSENMESTASMNVQSAQVSTDRKHLLIQVVKHEGGLQKKMLLTLRTSSFTLTPTNDDLDGISRDLSVLIETNVLPGDVSFDISTPLSFTSGNRLIFIRRDFAVCSWQFQPSPKLAASASASSSNSAGFRPVKELFYLPGDWTSREASAISTVWKKEKTFMCPKNGEVALVKCAGLA